MLNEVMNINTIQNKSKTSLPTKVKGITFSLEPKSEAIVTENRTIKLRGMVFYNSITGKKGFCQST